MKVTRILAMFTVLVATGLALVALRADTHQAGFQIGRAEARQRELKRSILQLELDVARLRDPARLEAERARLDIELHPPGPPDDLWLIGQ